VIAFSGIASKLTRLVAQGWLKCDGSPVSRNQYPTLFTAIGTTYGGDGNPNFNLPDLRGFFLRGVNEGTGRDPDASQRLKQGQHPPAPPLGDNVGSWQSGQLVSHQHNWNHFFHVISYGGSDIAVHQPPDSDHLQSHPAQATNDDGGNETRPKNVYVYYLIATGAG
jgi:phage-related tail fiber protein